MRTTTGRVLFVVLGCALAACQGESIPDEPEGDPGSTDDGLSRVVTLITGHRVTVRGGRAVSIDSPPGGSVAVRSLRAGEHLYVIPVEAAPLIQRGLVDRRLFDVAELLRLGYDDAQRDDLPVIVTYRSDDGRRGAAMRVPRRGEPAFWAALTGSGPGGAAPALADGVAGVWLDVDRSASPAGRIAGSPDQTARTPVPVNEALESHDLTVEVIDRDGARLDTTVLLFDLEAGDLLFIQSSTPVELPSSRYAVDVTYFWSDADGDHAVSMVQPRLRLDRPTTVTMDAREARPIDIDVPVSSARRVLEAIEYGLFTRVGTFSAALLISDAPERFGFIYTDQVGPSAPPREFESTITSIWARRGADPADRFFDSPYVYNTAFLASSGGFPTGFVRQVASADLAVVRNDYAATTAGLVGSTMDFGLVEGTTLVTGWGDLTSFHLPFRRTSHYLAEGVSWRRVSGERGAEPFPWNSELEAPFRELEAGTNLREHWNQAVIGPSMNPGDGATFFLRLGDDIVVAFPSYYSDQANHHGFAPLGVGSARLFRDGEQIGESDQADFAFFPVPPEDAAYRLEVQSARGGDMALSTQVDVAWTFRSSAGGDFALPTLAARFLPELDEDNSAPAGEPFVLPIVMSRQQDAAVSPIKRLRVDVSYDRGQRWRRVTVVRFGDLALATYDHPRKSGGTVSLRARAADEDDNTVEQVILDAYHLRAGIQASRRRWLADQRQANQVSHGGR